MQVGISHDKANTGIQFAGMPFHLGDDPALSLPASSLITETGVIAPHMVGRTANGTGEQMGDAFLKNRVGFETDGVGVGFGLQKLIDVR